MKKDLQRAKNFLASLVQIAKQSSILAKKKSLSNVIVHCLRETGSWIYQPLTVEVFISSNGTDFTSVGLTDDFIIKTKGLETGTMKVEFAAKNSRYVKVVVKNWGEIPAGNPGAGNKAWLFVDEIEVN